MGHRQAGRGAAATLAVVLVFVAVVARAVQSGPSELAHLTQFQEATQIDVGPELSFFGAGLDGDGQTYALIASDPLARQEGSALFDPDYRYARSGFAWMAAIVVLGIDSVLLAGLAIVGLASVGVVAYVAVRQREALGLKAWWLIANPALYLAVMGDTGESLGILLLTLAFLHRRRWSALALAIVRPSYLLALADLRWLFIPALGVALGFRALWILRFDGSLASGMGSLGLPLGGLIAEPSLMGLVVTAAAVVTIVIGFRHRSWSWILSGLLVVCLSPLVHSDPVNAVRSAGMLPVLWAFYGTERPRRDTDAEEKSLRALLP